MTVGKVGRPIGREVVIVGTLLQLASVLAFLIGQPVVLYAQEAEEAYPGPDAASEAYQAMEEAALEGKKALAKGDLEAAKTVLERGVVIAGAEENRQALADFSFYLGVVNQEQEEFQTAEGHYRQVLSLRPGSTSALNNLGLVYARQSNYRSAAEALQQAIRLEKTDERKALYIANYAGILESTGDLEAAERELRRAVRLSADNEAIHSQVIAFYIRHKQSSIIDYLTELVALGRVRKAEGTTTELLERLSPKESTSHELLDQLLIVLALSLSKQYYTPEEFLSSQTANVLRQRGSGEVIGEGAYELWLLHTGEELAPSAYPWWAARGQEWSEVSRGASLRDAFRALARSLGDRYVSMSRYEIAEQYYRLAILLWPEKIDPEALLRLADVFVVTGRLGSLEELMHSFERPLFHGKGEAYRVSDLPSIHTFHKTLGIIYAQLGRWGDTDHAQSAIFQLEHAIRIADRYNMQITPGREQQLIVEPRVYHLLALGYSESGQQLSGFRLRVEAAEIYLAVEDRESARQVLIPDERWHFTIPSSAPEPLMEQYRRLRELLTR